MIDNYFSERERERDFWREQLQNKTGYTHEQHTRLFERALLSRRCIDWIRRQSLSYRGNNLATKAPTPLRHSFLCLFLSLSLYTRQPSLHSQLTHIELWRSCISKVWATVTQTRARTAHAIHVCVHICE